MIKRLITAKYTEVVYCVHCAKRLHPVTAYSEPETWQDTYLLDGANIRRCSRCNNPTEYRL